MLQDGRVVAIAKENEKRYEWAKRESEFKKKWCRREGRRGKLRNERRGEGRGGREGGRERGEGENTPLTLQYQAEHLLPVLLAHRQSYCRLHHPVGSRCTPRRPGTSWAGDGHSLQPPQPPRYTYIHDNIDFIHTYTCGQLGYFCPNSYILPPTSTLNKMQNYKTLRTCT